MNWLWRRRREQDLDRELRSHLDLETQEQRDSGVDSQSARFAARRAFGNHTLIRENTRAAWGWNGLERLIQDLRYAWRSLRKSPGFALIAIVVLALGTGANTAIFSIFHAVLLRPLPFPEPDRVMMLSEKIPRRNISRTDLCAANFFDLQQRSRSFASMAALSGSGFALTGEASPEQVPGAQVSAQFFSVVGVYPERGRAFQPLDEEPGQPRVVVIADRLWQRRFGGVAAILGKTILINGQPHQVIGIMPRGFQAIFRDQELWVPLQLTAAERANRSSHYLIAAGRLKQGITPQQAQAELDTIAATLEREYPESNSGRGLRAAPVREELVGDTRSVLLLLMGAVSLLLLVACVNVANLLLARAASRAKEMAIRRAVGAGAGRLVQQLLTEGLLLSILGVGAGLLVALWILRSLPLLIPAGLSLPGLDRVAIDGPVLMAAGLTAAVVSLLFGCMPALQIFRAANPKVARYRLRSALLAVEVAFSLVLVLGSGLLLRSFAKLAQVPPGFRADRVLSVQLQMPDRRQSAFFSQVRERVQAIPGVENVAAIEYLPLSGSVITRRIAVEGQPVPNPGEEPIAQRHIVSPEYFRTMGIPLKSGRAFADADMRAEPLVALINESMAHRYWPDRNPVGQHVRLGFQARVANAPAREIVGVVGDVRHASLRSDPRDEVYVPLGQEPWPATRLVLRSVINPEDIAHDLKNAVWAVDKNQPLPGLTTMTDVLAESVWEPRLNTLVLTIFAAITLMLALAGIYGLMTRVVGDRTPEIGIRMALGARPASVLRLVLREGLAPVLLGTAAGVAMAIAGGRLIAAQLYGINGQDPVTFGAGVLIIVTAALLAMAFPALRAARIDPMSALRHE